jgi:hypothetical protein
MASPASKAGTRPAAASRPCQAPGLVEDIQADWAERIGNEAMSELLDLLQQLGEALGFEYSRRIGGLPNDTP